MKKITLFLLISVVAVTVFAQRPVKVETFKLDNGLKVILCEEHSTPQIYGCVVVHAGSKNEKATATGVAHYFEHIMFKGTDRIGTTDWKAEKRYLDSISQAYDRLQATSNAAQRHDIQKEINRLNIAASKYAIPNEVAAILQNMGCTGLNASTSYDYTVYYNTLPSNQLSNWMDVYVERFRNPVFRLFQSELEAVYEEKNMYENQMGYDFFCNIFTESFGDHPYSRDIVGLAEHLKNPQPSEMQKFFDTYYVANNMTLILVGDFNSAEARSLVQNKFSEWRSGEIPAKPTCNLPTFDKQRVKEVKQTPIKMGVMVFPGVNNRHPDYLPLQMMGQILGGGSGLLNRAVSQGRLMEAQLMPISWEDAGSNVVLYVPNILGQSHEEAERIVWDCIDSIRQGNIPDQLIESVKMSAVTSRQQFVESLESLSGLLLELELEGSDYDQWLRDNQRWISLTPGEIAEVANRYFSRDHCTLVRSKMGFPKHDTGVKPDWDHLEAQNQGVQSSFAKMIANNKPEPIKPQYVDFRNDVNITELTPSCKLYSTQNPKNDIFNLQITYKYGSLDNPDIDRAISYLEKLGANGKDRQEFVMALDCLGGWCGIGNGDEESYIYIGGLEQNIDSILALTAQWLFNPTHDARQITNIVDEIKASQKAAKNSSDTWFSALKKFVTYGNKSSFLAQTPYKEWGTRTGQQLHNEVLQMLSRNGHATFTGNTDPGTLCARLCALGLVRDSVQVMPHRAYKEKQYKKSQLFYATNKKFLQSDINITLPSINFDTADRAVASLFNEYFGGGMNSVIFQEIREFRSLGYSTYGYFSYNIFNLNPASTRCYLGTQCDKTYDGVEALRDLLVALPQRPDKLAPAIEHQKVTRNSNHYTFRDIPTFVYNCIENQGWDYDRRAEITEQITNLTMDDLVAFHTKYIKDRPLVVIISGNAKKFNPKSVLELLGPKAVLTEVKYDQMIKF